MILSLTHPKHIEKLTHDAKNSFDIRKKKFWNIKKTIKTCQNHNRRAKLYFLFIYGETKLSELLIIKV